MRKRRRIPNLVEKISKTRTKKPRMKPATVGKQQKTVLKLLYIPPKRMLNLIHKKQVVSFKQFSFFSKLSPKKTQKLWKLLESRAKNIRGKRPIHSLILLLVANKILVEKNKTFKQIVEEINKLGIKSYTERLRKINNFLNLRSNKEKLFKKGGYREKLSPEKEQKIFELMKKGLSDREIAEELEISERIVKNRIHGF